MFANLALAELQETRPDPASPRPARVSVAQDLSVEGDERQLRMLMTELVRNSWNFSNGEVVLDRSEEHTSELQSLMRISYAVFCLKKKKKKIEQIKIRQKRPPTQKDTTQ